MAKRDIQKRKGATACGNDICKWLRAVSNYKKQQSKERRTEKTDEYHTHLNVNAFLWFFAIEHPLDVKVGTSGVLMHR